MQDVIFSGTEMRKPLGYAYVAITLDNADHQLTIDYDEVTVSRRLYRSGESEYMINGTVCRLKDVNELFYDTGIGKEGYSIIGQGQIDKILSGKPEERRELFDEAAGIVKFKRRKYAAQKKLEDEKLEYLKNEKYYVDIGLGFQEDKNGNLIPSSGFNAALNGINFFGCGLDGDGDPKNIYSIVQKLTEISDSASEGGDWGSVYDEFKRLVGKLETASSNFKTEFTNMAASTTKLENNEKLLEDNFYNLQEQYAALEDVDMVDSITSFIWAQYCYNAALKVGNNVLSESLMDYLR